MLSGFGLLSNILKNYIADQECLSAGWIARARRRTAAAPQPIITSAITPARSTARQVMHVGKKHLLPRRRFDLNGADLVHEVNVFHRVLRRQRGV